MGNVFSETFIVKLTWLFDIHEKKHERENSCLSVIKGNEQNLVVFVLF